MLSRSNSRTGERLRRTKSTSSTHTAGSGHHRTPASIDPSVARQQAEAAAIEAYYRARQLAQPCNYSDRPAPPKLQRRRSHRTTEGSHFEEARLGRKKSALKKDEGKGVGTSRVQQPRGLDGTGTTASSVEEKVVIRRRSIIPPTPDAIRSYAASQTTSMPPMRTVDGAPVPDLHLSSIPRVRPVGPRVQPSLPQRSGDYYSQLSALSNFGEPVETSHLSIERRTPKRPVRETQTDEEILALARDRCLQDFQQQTHLRERKSFLTCTLHKLRGSSTQRINGPRFDTSLPPFNLAEGGLALPSLASPPPLPLVGLSEMPCRADTLGSRNFSESLKGRLKRVFRKTSRAPNTLPIQHIQSRQLHAPVLARVSTPMSNQIQLEDPFFASSEAETLDQPDLRPGSAASAQSAERQSTTRSRVTSWTDSTLDTQQGDVNVETVSLRRSDSTSTLRTAGSFLGRPVRHILRRSSRKGLNNSDDSAGLYSALRERIRPSKSFSQPSESEDNSVSRSVSGLSTLPSQLKQAASSVSSASHWGAPTIRPVTPDIGGQDVDVLSPVTEVLSPPDVHNLRSNREYASPRGQLQRRPAIKTTTPTKAQLSLRIERSRNRWRTALDEASPPLPRSLGYSREEDNPYELPSLSRTLPQPEHSVNRPYHYRVGERGDDERNVVLSPSLYSRETDGATPSPRPQTPVDRSGMVVTITGHEVHSYPISPPKRKQLAERPAQSSREWRRWLSGELKGWSEPAASELLSLPKGILKNRKSSSPVDVEALRQMDEREALRQQIETCASSPSLASDVTEIKPQRSRPTARLFGSMNDRYPVLGSVRSSSGITIDRKTPETGDRIASSSSVLRKPVGGNDDQRQDGTCHERVITKCASAFEIRALKAINSEEDQSSKAPAHPTTPTDHAGGRLSGTASRRATAHPKSAFDLRANYKSGRSSPTKRLEVRRKGLPSHSASMLEDSTIRNISAGPYAPPPSPHHSPAMAALGINAADANKENASPPDPGLMPWRPSSEWMAAGPEKRRDANKAALRREERMQSRFASARPTESGNAEGSPGQRLVTGWLEGKRSKENSPAAFV